MRKRVLMLLLVLIAAVSAVAVAAANLGAAQEQVTYQESSAYGDKSAADGLTVSIQYSYRGRAFWFVDHTFGETDATQTAFHFYNFPPDLNDSVYDGSAIEIWTVGDPFDSEWMDQIKAGGTDQTEYPGLLGAYKALYDATEEGALTNTYVRYSDYCDYYPIAGILHLPGHLYGWNPYADEQSFLRGGEAAQAFNAFFKIPVLEDDWVQMIVDKRVSGSVMESVDVSIPRTGTDYYEMGAAGTCSGNTVYFTFDAHTANGNLVDTSLIPGGYGLYSFTYQDDGTIDCDSLTNLRPLDITHCPQQMRIDDAHNYLLYFTTKDLDDYLTVIDLETLETLQQICIQKHNEENWQWLHVQEDFILGITEGVEISIYKKNALGLYDFCFTTPLSAEIDLNFYDAQFAFNGEYLAITDCLYVSSEDRPYWYSRQKCGFALSVYSESGLVYYGEYTSSLETPEGFENNFDPCSVYAAQVFWN